MKKILIHSLIFLFGVFYLFSGVVKIIDIDNFLFLIRFYKIKPLIYLAPAVPIVEIIVGLMLVFRIRLKEVVFFSVIMLLGFTLIFSYGYFFMDIDDCGCFGGVDFLKMSPVLFFIRNGILVLLNLHIYNSLTKEKKPIKLYQLITILAVAIVFALITGIRSDLNKYVQKTAYTRSTIDEYHNGFIGKNINETILSEYINTDKDSTYIVFVFSYNCPHCMFSSIYLNKYEKNNVADKVIGISNGTRKEKKFFTNNIKPQFEINDIKAIDIHQITGFYPLSFYVKNDTIRFKVKGALPTYDKFYEKYFNSQLDTIKLN